MRKLPAGMIAAAALVWAGAAMADPPYQVTVGGQQVQLDAGGQVLMGAATAISDDDGPGEAAARHGSGGVQADFLARLGVDTKFGDGIGLGAAVRLRVLDVRGEDTTVKPDAGELVQNAYIRLSREDLGELRLGADADARMNKAYEAPQICSCLDGFYGSNDPQVTVNHGPVGVNTTAADFDGRAAKIGWYSPNLDGFQLALSYAPGREREQRNTPTAQHDFASAALAWDRDFAGVSVGLDGGVSRAGQNNPVTLAGRDDADPFIWDFGGQLGYGPWKFGAAYEQQHGIDTLGIYGAAAFSPVVAVNGVVTRTIDTGFTYSLGPLTAGIAWSRGLYQGLADPADLKRAAANDVVFTGVDYLVRAGIDLLGGVQWNRYDPQGPYRPLPAAAALNAIYGGGDPTLNIWGKAYQGVALVLGVALRF